ncbi:MAG: aminopeptidase [Bacteroidetes bacterium GWE2_29_8]|nr:MAG: aminopeptidase [Bacteroidetes bacterium GWE2_29_8]OFY20645.1 MAG: aminopeptidase [Bacteroidetes bacterium GWF2_29_10]
MNLLKIISLALILIIGLNVSAQDNTEKKDTGYVFTNVKELKTTSVKDQYRSGTCWSFSSISFIESELMRMGKGEYDLSEMFVVRQSYIDKADLYVRMHGSVNFAGGGAFHDITNCMKKYGVVPEEAYLGLEIGEKKHIHGEMDAVLKSFVDAIIKNPNRQLTPVWKKAYSGILDAYLGKYPENFTYKGKNYTPQTFAKDLGVNPDDYIEITSFTHHPFYSKFIMEVPDNWGLGEVYNVPLKEMEEIMDYAINNGYSIAWGADVSEKGFSWKNGVAIVPEQDIAVLNDLERSKWEALSEKDKEAALYKFEKPGKEKVITQEMRQEGFDNYNTGDDHGMHITGIAKDQNGNQYYIVKNSWNTEGNSYKGYFYASKPYFLYKTMDFMVHKNGIPPAIRKKLGIN